MMMRYLLSCKYKFIYVYESQLHGVIRDMKETIRKEITRDLF